MHRLPLLLCAIALVGSVTSGVLYFRIGHSKQALEQRLADAGKRTVKLDRDLAAANERTGALKAQLSALARENDGLRVTVATVEQRVATAKAKLAATVNEVAETKSVVALYEETARALADEVDALRGDLADSRASQASPDAVLGYKNTIAELERQLALARNGAAVPATAGASTAVFASRAGRATVLTVGPQNAFVVLNFGSLRGAQLGQKLTVSQGASVVATVAISDVRSHFSVAQVMPDSVRAVLQKGDSAVLIR